MERILPIIVSTWAALEAAAPEQWPVIYVDEGLYRARGPEVRALLGAHHYTLFWKRGRRGMFFLLTQGENRFDHSRHHIHDPAGSL